MAEVTSFTGIFEYMYIKNAEVFFIKMNFDDDFNFPRWIIDLDPDPGFLF